MYRSPRRHIRRCSSAHVAAAVLRPQSVMDLQCERFCLAPWETRCHRGREVHFYLLLSGNKINPGSAVGGCCLCSSHRPSHPAPLCCIRRLRALVQDALAKHLTDSAAFFADKLVALSSGQPADVYLLAQVGAL